VKSNATPSGTQTGAESHGAIVHSRHHIKRSLMQASGQSVGFGGATIASTPAFLLGPLPVDARKRGVWRWTGRKREIFSAGQLEGVWGAAI
jgi:hypothetical protein